jgi:ribA/ribD-fused uncharacterized protein
MINKFDGKYAFLSNYYPCAVFYEGIAYPSVEHAFQAAKTLDMTKRFEIANLESPGASKRAGRKLDLRSDWEEVKYQVMEDCLRAKFKDPKLLVQLVATEGQFLIEGTTWHDQCWGICTCDKCGGNGSNHLGKLLMKIRDEYIDFMDEIRKGDDCIYD